MRAQAIDGRAVLISSHLLAEVAQSVDDVIVIANGELRAQGTLASVLGGDEGPETEVTAEDPDALAKALTAAGATVLREGDKLLVPGMTPGQVGAVAGKAGLTVLGLAPRARSLEQAFLALTADQRQ